MIQMSIIPLFVFLFFITLVIKKGHQKRLPLPPGPPKLPFIGNMNQLLSPTPHHVLGDLAKKYGPVMHLKLGFVSTIVISSAEAAKQIMKINDTIFSNRPKLVAPEILGYNHTDVAFAPYGAYWRQLRKICILELFTAKRVNSFRHIREEQVRSFIRSIASTSPKPINMAERLFFLNHSIITRITCGDSSDDIQQQFRIALKEATVLAGGFQVGDFFPSLSFVGTITGMKKRLQKNFQQLDGIMNKIIGEHIERSKSNKPEREDFVDVLLRLKDTPGLEVPVTTDNAKSVILDLFAGGTENSSNIVEWAMTEMIKNPRIMEKAHAQVREVVGKKATVDETDLRKLPYISMIIKETLRYHPPVPMLLPRESMERCTIDGYEIPEKTRVLINYWAISRDPVIWKNPDTFEPERFENGLVDFRGHDFEYIPFGAGRRICPGISFGVVNTELTLATLLYHFDWKLPEGLKQENLDVGETFGMTLYKTNNLYLVPTLRYPVPT